jgi:hypothetical protein
MAKDTTCPNTKFNSIHTREMQNNVCKKEKRNAECSFFFKIVICVIQIDFFQQYFGILSKVFTGMPYSNKRYIGSISGDVKVSLYCDYHMHAWLTLFCISLVWIELNFVFGHVVSFAIQITQITILKKKEHSAFLFSFLQSIFDRIIFVLIICISIL